MGFVKDTYHWQIRQNLLESHGAVTPCSKLRRQGCCVASWQHAVTCWEGWSRCRHLLLVLLWLLQRSPRVPPRLCSPTSCRPTWICQVITSLLCMHEFACAGRAGVCACCYCPLSLLPQRCPCVSPRLPSCVPTAYSHTWFPGNPIAGIVKHTSMLLQPLIYYGLLVWALSP